MSEILTQMFSLPVQIALAVVAIIVIMLYLLSIVWVFRDARERDAPAIMWAIIAIIPVAGLVAYCLLRPNLAVLDRDEQDMQLDLLQRQLDEYMDCPHCGYPAQKDFVVCPRCHHQLRNRCTRCGRTLEPEWTMCPYCTQPVGAAGSSSRGSSARGGSSKGGQGSTAAKKPPAKKPAPKAQPAPAKKPAAKAQPSKGQTSGQKPPAKMAKKGSATSSARPSSTK